MGVQPSEGINKDTNPFGNEVPFVDFRSSINPLNTIIRSGWQPHFSSSYTVSGADPELLNMVYEAAIAWGDQKVRALGGPKAERLEMPAPGETNRIDLPGIVVQTSRFERSPDAPIETELPKGAWDISIVHPDSMDSNRVWRLSIGAKDYPGSPEEPNQILLSVVSTFRDAAPLPLPAPSVPFLRHLSQTLGNSAKISSGRAELCRDATILDSPEKVYEFMATLRDDSRRHPVVLASTFWEKDGGVRYMASAPELTRSLNGLAQVFIEDSRSISLGGSTGLADILACELGMPEEYLAWGGAVRVYRPGDILKLEPSDHRYMRRHDFEGKSEFLHCLRNGAYLLAQHDFALDRREPIVAGVDIERYQQIARLDSLRKASEASINSVDVVALRQEVREWQDIAGDLDKSNGELRENLKRANTTTSELKSENQGLRESLSGAYAEISELHARIKTISAQGNSSDPSEVAPESLTNGEAVLGAVRARFGERLGLTSKFERSLRDFEPNDKALFGTVYEAIEAIHDHLWSGKFEKKTGNFIADFRDSTRFQLSLTESKLTKEKPGLRALRVDEYEGETFEAWAHVKFGNRPGEQFRIHFEFFEDSEKIVLSWVGDHLPTSSSGKNGGRRG